METSAVEKSDSFYYLTQLCNGPFWNVSTAWEAEVPDFGTCAERTVLVWLPCLLLWLCAPIYIFHLKSRPIDPVPWTAVSYTKMMVSALLVIVWGSEIVWAGLKGPIVVPTADFIAPIVLLITQALHVILVASDHRHGKRTSGLLWCFWLSMLMCGIPQLYTTVITTVHGDGKLPAVLVVTFLVQYLCCLALFITNCISHAPSKLQSLFMTEKASPKLQASFLSRLFFLWNAPLIWRGWRNPLTFQDMWDVVPEDSALSVFNLWQDTMAGLLISFITNKTEPMWHGYLYAVMMLLICECASIVKNNFFDIALILSVRVRSALMSAVYAKALKLSGSARRESTLGQIVNLMAVDAQIIGDTVLQIYGLLFAPLIILVCLILLWQELGPSVLTGLVFMLLIIPINSVLVNKSKLIQEETMTIRDKRVRMTSEIINGIKVLKLYAWEGSFAAKVEEVRKKEMKLLTNLGILQSINSFIFNVTPYMVALVTFTTYLLVSEDNILNAQKAFVSLSLFNIMRFPIIQMPTVISQIIQASVSLVRMEKYLSADELDPFAVLNDTSGSSSVVVHGGEFCWDGDEGNIIWHLRDIDVEVECGQLMAVVGPVGAGKSSFMSALLGEMKKTAGRVAINGSLAYVSQQAWLQNATLRENIIWGLPFNRKRYQKVVRACALQADLDMLPAGDMTEIGEKGINISGGQKQRVALARAVYSNSEIILLDDPLSAVDAHVGRHLFEQVIGPHGVLKGKTRVLVTHSVTVLPQVDYVVVMKDGRMVEKGTYDQLVSSGGEFAQFIVQHLNDMGDEDVKEELDELYEHLEGVAGGEPLLQQLSLRKSSINITRVQEMVGRHRSASETDPGSGSKFTTYGLNDSCPVLTRIGSSQNCDNISVYSSITSVNEYAATEGHDLPKQNTMNWNLSLKKGQILVEEETTETGKIAGHVYKVYIRAMGLMYALPPLILMTLGQACNAGSNIWLSDWSSSNSINSTNSSAVSRDTFLTFYGAFGVGQSFFMFMGILVIMLGTLRSANYLHHNLLRNVVRLPMSFFDTNPSGRIINRFGKEVNVLDTVLPGTLRAYTTILTLVVTTMIVIVVATPIAAAFIVPMMIVYYIIQQVFVTTSRQLKRIESVSKSPIYSHFSETIQGASVIRAFKKQDDFFQESLQLIENSLKAIYVNVGVNRWLGVHLETIGNLITFAAAILGVAGRETISPGIVGLSVSYALNVTAILNWLVRIVSDAEANIISAERINEYIQLEQEAPWKLKDQTSPKSWPKEGRITFSNYETRYRPGLELVLKGITCTIKPAEKVGIVGRTGAGKSSLTLALFRLIEPSGGQIDIDGVDITKIGLHDLRGHISIIPQDPVLFSGTLRMNLDPFDVHEDMDIWHALELAHLSQYIRSQPQGLEHMVDEDGSNFSVGQRQLVCLARALLRNSQVLVLDEATAAVDLETDKLLQTTIRKHFNDCTVLTIAHRLNTIIDYDRVMVLKEGKIVEFDSPSALLSCPDSIFYGLAQDAGIPVV
ncbi:multidrug resistance-associated protein 1-like isoform X2 [Homarus americanus]|uniref:multidrug resistance-associated protein 1-like isoform X2 n=1 Tax=Homarus americanus TaxID=6706 RepID=UPI001C48AB1F|nr:multidrug resistance-associated protein 1-like isoform X2 [Homarus americanus]